MWHMTCDMWLMTCDMWHTTHDRFVKVNLLFGSEGIFEDLEDKGQSLKKKKKKKLFIQAATIGWYQHWDTEDWKQFTKQDNTWRLRNVSGTNRSTCFLKRKRGLAQSQPLSIPDSFSRFWLQISNVPQENRFW